jgi:hypothetical protein
MSMVQEEFPRKNFEFFPDLLFVFGQGDDPMIVVASSATVGFGQFNETG